MRILVLTINYWPEQTGIGAVMTRRCEYLAARGHEVTVCTGMPYYPEWRVHGNYYGKVFQRESRNGVTILRSWIWVPQRVTPVKRVFFEASFLASSLLRALRGPKPDLLLVISPPLGLALSAKLLSRWFKVPYVFDVEDLQPDAAADLGMLPARVLPMLYRLEAMAYDNAALISTITEGMRNRILAKGIASDKTVVIPHPAATDLFSVGTAIDGAEFRRRYGLEGKFVIGHSGNMGVKQGLNVVLDTALRFREQREMVFLLTGDGVMKTHLQARAKSLRLENVRFLPLQEHAEFLRMLAATDLALIVQQAAVSDIAFPSKTVTLLSAARPIAAAVQASSEIGRVVRQAEAGIVTQPGDAEALTGSIQGLFHEASTRSRMGRCGRRYAMLHWDEPTTFNNLESSLLTTCAISEGALAEEEAVA